MQFIALNRPPRWGLLVLSAVCSLVFAVIDGRIAARAEISEPSEVVGHLYWTNGSAIYRAAPDGENPETMLDGLPLRYPVFSGDGEVMYGIGSDDVIRRANADGAELTALLVVSQTNQANLRLDEEGGKLYWTEADRIRRANLDGSAPETLATGVTSPLAFRIHVEAGKLYWIDTGDPYKIQRVDLDGGEVEDVIVNDAEHGALGCFSLDPVDGKLYWQVWETGFYGPVMRANLDGSSPETLPLDEDVCPILDGESRKLYWRTVEESPMRVQRSNLDGTNIETLYEPDNEHDLINDLTVDSSGGYLYWRVSPGAGIYSFRRFALAGGAVEDILTFPEGLAGTEIPIGLRFGPNRQTLYWQSDNQIQRVANNGDNLESVIVGATEPNYLQRNPIDNRLYWSDRRSIRSAALDGSDGAELVRVREAHALTLDVESQTLYWLVQREGGNAFVVQRAPLATLNVEELGELSGLLEWPFVFDLANMHVYAYQTAVDEALRGIARANFDGSGTELLVPIPFGPPNAFALDSEAGHLYWIRGIEDGVIQRANLDGSDVITLVTGLSWTESLALDTENGKLYWVSETDEEMPVIWRANLDGSEQELFSTSRGDTLYFDPLGIPESEDPEDEDPEEEEEDPEDEEEPETAGFTILVPSAVGAE